MDNKSISFIEQPTNTYHDIMTSSYFARLVLATGSYLQEELLKMQVEL